MAAVVANIAKGRVNEFFNRVKNNDPTNAAIVIVVLGATGIDSLATLQDFDDLAAVLAANNEVNNTGYARKVLVDADLAALAPDDSGNFLAVDIADQTWSAVAADGTQGNWAVLALCYDSDTTAGTDANIIPLCFYDFPVVPDGNDIVAVINAAGVFKAS